MKFFIASPWKNKEEVKTLGDELKKRGHEVYSFIESGANLMTGQPIEDEMRAYYEALGNWKKDARISQIFNSELEGLKSSDVIVMLLPAGDSSHMEAGIGFGLGKKMILVGPINKPEVVYLVFDEIYPSVATFVNSLG